MNALLEAHLLRLLKRLEVLVDMEIAKREAEQAAEEARESVRRERYGLPLTVERAVGDFGKPPRPPDDPTLKRAGGG